MEKNRPHSTIRGKRGGRAFAPAFTMVEIMFAILILSLLLGLLITGVRMATKTSKSTVDHQTVNAIRVGASQFKQQFGFPMPIVRERSVDPVPGQHTFITVGTGASQRNIVCVYQPKDPDYVQELQGEELATLRGANPNNPFIDYRYSERSIPIYLVGQLDVPMYPSQPNGPVIDGIRGPGLCKPLPDGTFAVPADLMHATGATAPTTARTGATFDPFITITGGAPKLMVDPYVNPSAARPENVWVADRNGVAIRYYQWAPEATVSSLDDLNVPLIVGRAFTPRTLPALRGYPPADTRDLAKNPAIKSATFAIVAAGADGFFGDEVNDPTAPAGDPRRDAFDRMMIAAGFSASDTDPNDIIRARVKVEADNIVEVGQ
jgi:type II secretory pathway pseudopilin PulG